MTLIIGLAIGYLGPFGSFEMPLSRRLLYWVLLISSGHLIYFQVGNVFDWYFSKKTTHPIVTFVFSSLIAALLFSFVVAYVSELFFSSNMSNLDKLIFFFPKVFILGLIMNLLGFLIDNLKERQTAQQHDKQPPTPNHASTHQVFLDRLPKNLGTELICFVMEDHYLHVYTDQGDHMLLLRMKDALVELKEYPGLQVHRSWWVATDAIASVEKHSRKATLTMNNGLKVPVSQKYLPALNSAGLL